MIIENNLEELIQIFPDYIKKKLKNHERKKDFVEIILDIGRRPEIRYWNHNEYFSQQLVSWQDLYFCLRRIGGFNQDNRTGIGQSLHRISCLKNQQGQIVGLTCRIGRNVIGKISIIRDLLETQQSLLILGRPGVGKTTIIREISRVLSEEMDKRTIIMDTSNEIAGHHTTFHRGIGKARRMQIYSSLTQDKIMMEAVENHTPDAIIVDEIGTESEALTARTIAERGVQLIGTAHGDSLENLLKNPVLVDLLGGIHLVTLSDEESRKRRRPKSILERKIQPTFDVAIEIQQKAIWSIHSSVEDSVDSFLDEKETIMQLRFLSLKKKQKILAPIIDFDSIFDQSYQPAKRRVAFLLKKKTLTLLNQKSIQSILLKKKRVNLSLKTYRSDSFFDTSCHKKLYVYFYDIPEARIQKILCSLAIGFRITKRFYRTDVIITNKNAFKKKQKLRQVARSKQISLYGINLKMLGEVTKTLLNIVARTKSIS